MYLIENKKLMAEWDWEKNNELGLNPEKLTYGSNKKAWWKCEKGHSWQKSIERRNNTNISCPYCNNKKTLLGYNDLNTLFPEIAADWDYEKNTGYDIKTINITSISKIWWKCAVCGNEWLARLRDRTGKGTGCPKCALKIRARKRIDTYIQKNGKIDNELFLKEWDYEKNEGLTPNMFTKSSNKKVWWKCSVCGYEWKSQINHRNRTGKGCPNCAGQVLIKGENDLETLSPQLAKEWNYEKNKELKPSDIRLNHSKKVWWICPQGHEYQATPNHRNTGTNCPICNSGRQTSFAEQAVYYYIKKIYPDAVNRYRDIFDNKMEVDIYIPSLKTAIEYDGVYWHNRKEKSKQREIIKYQKCKQQGIRLIRLRESISNTEHEIADICFHVENVDNINNLNMLIRHLLDEIDLRSNMWTRKNPRMVHSPVNVDADRDRFDILKYKQVLYKNNLKELYPELAEEWNYEKNGSFTPDKVTPGSGKRVWWNCKECGHEWITTVSRRVRGTKCPQCVIKYNKENHYLAKKVYQYSTDNKFLREWNSVSAAAKELNINDGTIRKHAVDGNKVYKGFIWKYEKE